MVEITADYIQRRTTAPLPDCMIWCGSTERGYARVQIDGKWYKVHRIAWELNHGTIPDDLVIDHLCRVRACVNTAHMELVTVAENNRRSAEHRVGVPVEPGYSSYCKNGHPYPEDSPPVSRGGFRCRVCRKEGYERRRAATKAAARAGGSRAA